MNRKTRYSLLAFGFLVFLFVAPLIVLYVRGISFDFKTKTFVKSGILAVSSEPKDVNIYLNGELKRQNAGDIKFVPPGEYQVDIKKDGYSPWGKRLSVQAGQVTWANSSFNKIYLFFKDPTAKILSNDVLDFYATEDKIFVLTKTAFLPASLSGVAESAGYPLPKSVNKILAYDDSARNFVLVGTPATTSAPTLLFFNTDSGKFSDLTGLFLTLPSFQFNGQDLYALDGNTLFKINAASKTKTPLLAGLDSFYFQGGNLYYIQNNATSSSLILAAAPFTANQQPLSSLSGVMENSQLLVTPQKHIFIFEQGDLYSASASMQKLADNVSAWSFDKPSSILSVLHAGELDYFDPFGNTLNFVTRNGSQISNPNINTGIGYAFFLSQGNIGAIELDIGSGQNQYTLYSGSVQKFYVDDAGKNIFLLDGGELKSLAIR